MGDYFVYEILYILKNWFWVKAESILFSDLVEPIVLLCNYWGFLNSAVDSKVHFIYHVFYG